MNEYKPIYILGLPVRTIDAAMLGGLIFFLLLAAVFSGRLDNPLFLIGKGLLAGCLYIGSILWLTRLRTKTLRFLVRTASVQFMFLLEYFMARDLQLIFFSWNDRLVLVWEKALFGGQPLVWIQNLYSPMLTEWMMFVYIVYIVIYPVLGAVIFFQKGEQANEDYLFHLGAANLLCGLGFVVFPVAGPLRFEEARSLLTVPFEGGFFTQVSEILRSTVHAPGGTIPSPHCAAATVMWIMAWRYARREFFLLAPVILSLYVSTVYGRFHYASDSIIGILAGFLVLAAGPTLVRGWNRVADSHIGRRR
ncbi:MAG: phosphatase PAP2 family protein [Clostridiales bacterium]|nr:phosphatase PAP2 family protein [Clostridiales bacterium]